MQNHTDNFQAHNENELFELAVLSVIGGREEQQDSVGFEMNGTEGIVVVCDGMGGHNGGKTASSIGVDMLLKRYKEEYPIKNVNEMLLSEIENIDKSIASLKDANGARLRAGSTMIAVVVKQDKLYWVSVGDSRIYIYRNEELVRATQDHIYKNVLDEKMANGSISEELYLSEMAQGEALISFLGIDGLPVIDNNEIPFALARDDKILLMSDGLYKLVSDEEIGRILSNFSNIQDALGALDMKAQRAAKKQNISRDNMTIALLKIR